MIIPVVEEFIMDEHIWRVFMEPVVSRVQGPPTKTTHERTWRKDAETQKDLIRIYNKIE